MTPPQDGHDGYSHVDNGPPGILVELEGVERSVIIDTGADINVISKKIVDSQGWTKFTQKNNEQIMGVNGQATETEGTIELQITIDRWKPKKVKFFVLDTNEFHALLGTGFLKKHKCSLSYENDPPKFSWITRDNEKKTIECTYQSATNHLGWKLKQVLMMRRNNPRRKKKNPPQQQGDHWINSYPQTIQT